MDLIGAMISSDIVFSLIKWPHCSLPRVETLVNNWNIFHYAPIYKLFGIGQTKSAWWFNLCTIKDTDRDMHIFI